MAKRQVSSDVDTRIAVLDTALLDAFAQVEALLRCGREIQRNIIKLRGGNDANSPAQRGAVIERLRTKAAEMHEQGTEMVPLVRGIVRAARKIE